MYTRRNFRSKAEMKRAVKRGDEVYVFQPNALVPPPTDGEVAIEGPHYPEPHRWYSRVVIRDSRIVEVLS